MKGGEWVAEAVPGSDEDVDKKAVADTGNGNWGLFGKCVAYSC